MQLYKQVDYYQGKVRDVYYLEDERILLHASDRISAFDHILPQTIPHKGQVLNQTAAYFLVATKDIVRNWWIDSPIASASYGIHCEPLPIEVVVRGNLTGHALRTYTSGARTLSGVPLPAGMRPNDYFDTPIITPTTKASEGHDEDISREDIIRTGLVDEERYSEIEDTALRLFARGQEMASTKGLVLVDTKYEFGIYEDDVCLMDEIHTPDSSRYFEKEGLAEKIENGEKPDQLSKEFVREWLMSEGFRGLEGQQIPHMTPERVQSISDRYIALYERLTGDAFEAEPVTDIESTLNAYLQDIEI